MPSRSYLAPFIVLAAAAVALAQEQRPARPEGQPTFRTQANFVRVDVYPTADGAPVLDLRAGDFDVLEDGVRQSIERFEHVRISPAGPQSLRAEPNTVEGSKQLAANPRNRVFVLFLDVPHVTIQGAWHAREPLVRLVDRVLGPDDLVGIMTPRMTSADLVLARKTEVLAGGLRNKWPWGDRFTLEKYEQDWNYEQCYPWDGTRDVVTEMIARRRERNTLDAMNELVHYLGAIRDDRKAILTVSEGWLLFRPNRDLTRPRVINPYTGQTEPIPGPDPVGIGPGGKLTLGNPNDMTGGGALKSECDRDRVALAAMDNEYYFREIMDNANRWNATFYTIDPRGLPAFDNPIGPAAPPPPHVDQAMLKNRIDTLRTLASNTDGMAVVNSNDLDRGLRRISDDLTSYYLLGYYSTNTKFDGKFRQIQVRVNRPGVEVRARRGYRAATEAEVAAAREAAGPPVAEPVRTVQAAIAALERLRSVSRLRVNATAGPSTVWVYGEFQPTDDDDPLAKGATADVQVTAGPASATAQATLAPGERAFFVAVPLAGESGPVDVRARLSGRGPALTDSVRVERGALPSPVLYRRGPSTGNRLQPAASPQFSRTERVRLEIPIAADWKPGAARIMDRNAQPLNVPVAVSERTDAAGQRWLIGDLTLAALTIGDYAVEASVTTPSGERRVVTAIRVGR